MGCARSIRAALWLCALCGCGQPRDFAAGAGPGDDAPSSCAEVTAVPAAVVEQLDLDTGFYARHCQVFGIDVLGSERVSDPAMEEAGRLVEGVFADRPALRDAVHDRYFRVVIVASSAGEGLDEVPELRGLRKAERQAAGIGPDAAFPAATVRDSAILCRPREQDANATPPGDTLVHELGHAVLSMGLPETDPDFEADLRAAYEHAREHGLWTIEVPPETELFFGELSSSNYLMTNRDEYWATGVSAWFGFKPLPRAYALTDDDPPRLQLQVLYGRDALGEHDPDLAALLERVFGPEPELRHGCPAWIPSFQ